MHWPFFFALFMISPANQTLVDCGLRMKHCHWIMYDSEVEPAWAIEDYNEFQWHIEVSPLIRCWNTASYLSKHEAQSLDWEKKRLGAVYAISSPTPSSYIKVPPRSLRSSKVLSIHKKENAGEEKKKSTLNIFSSRPDRHNKVSLWHYSKSL